MCYFFWPWGAKTAHMQNLGDRFVVFFRGQNRNFLKVRGLKLQLSLILIKGDYTIMKLQ